MTTETKLLHHGVMMKRDDWSRIVDLEWKISTFGVVPIRPDVDNETPTTFIRKLEDQLRGLIHV